MKRLPNKPGVENPPESAPSENRENQLKAVPIAIGSPKRKARNKNQGPRGKNQEPRGKDQEPKGKNQEPRGKNQGPGARNQKEGGLNSALAIPGPEIQNKSEPDSYRVENPKSEITTMEVHHHPDLHHKLKHWKEYFLEFLMIFLAVTMGFFAETIRENISEGGKAKELAKSLYKEIYKDSVTMHNKLVLRERKMDQMEYFRRYVRDSSLTNLSPQFYPSFMWMGIITASIDFEPNDGILNQLRNSGELRYFKSIDLQNAISRINVTIYNIRDRNSHEYTFNEQHLRQFLLKHFDFTWWDDYSQNGKLNILQSLAQTNFHPKAPPRIRNVADFKREDADALVEYYLLILRSTSQVHYTPYVEANHELLQALRKEYHLENE